MIKIFVLIFTFFCLKSRAQELDVNVRGYLQGNIKLNDDQGILELGKLSQKYIDDPDLREILANTTLDAKKMEMFEGENLLLITSVICSEKFELIEGRKHKVLVYIAYIASLLIYSKNRVKPSRYHGELRIHSFVRFL